MNTKLGDEPTCQCCDFETDFSTLLEYCELIPRPLLVTGLLIQWMRIHFSNSLNIENPFLHEYLWDPNIETTKIVIDSIYRFNAAQSEYRPGIFIKRAPWKIIRYGIDDRKMPRRDKQIPICCEAVEEYNTMCQGSHVLFCVAGESAEAEILATEVYRELMQIGPVFRRRFNFLRFVVSDIGEISLLEEATENFVVPITVSYGAQDIWRICPPTVQEQVWLNSFSKRYQ